MVPPKKNRGGGRGRGTQGVAAGAAVLAEGQVGHLDQDPVYHQHHYHQWTRHLKNLSLRRPNLLLHPTQAVKMIPIQVSLFQPIFLFLRLQVLPLLVQTQIYQVLKRILLNHQ